MSSVFDALLAARTTRDWTALVGGIPYMSYLGLRVAHGDNDLVCTMPFAEHLIGNPGLPALHGGTIGALLESTAALTLLARAEELILPKTINLTIDYLLSGRAQDTYAAGTITRLGRRVANVSVTAWQTSREQPIASANVHFLMG